MQNLLFQKQKWFLNVTHIYILLLLRTKALAWKWKVRI